MDTLIHQLDVALRTLFAPHHAQRPNPAHSQPTSTLNTSDKKLSGALMRVNHVGEVCAQALYAAQSLASHNPDIKAKLKQASLEENDHLSWIEERLQELDARPSLLNPLWYAGAFTIGYVSAKVGGDAVNLGFVAETEKQVEQHLTGHIHRLPVADHASRAIVLQMQKDEMQHAHMAQAAGASGLSAPVQQAMKCCAQVMTKIAHHF